MRATIKLKLGILFAIDLTSGGPDADDAPFGVQAA